MKLKPRDIKRYNKIADKGGKPIMVRVGHKWYTWYEGDPKHGVFLTTQSGRDVEFDFKQIDDIQEGIEKLTKSKLKEMIKKEMNESDLPITTKKGKTVTVVHKTSGKELVVVNKPQVIKKYKRMGYLVNESINEAGMFDDYYELNPAYMDKFIKNYKKLNSKNLVKKKGGDVYGFRKGEREAHWKFDDDYKLHYDIDKTKALGLINFFNRAKKDHPWG